MRLDGLYLSYAQGKSFVNTNTLSALADDLQSHSIASSVDAEHFGRYRVCFSDACRDSGWQLGADGGWLECGVVVISSANSASDGERWARRYSRESFTAKRR